MSVGIDLLRKALVKQGCKKATMDILDDVEASCLSAQDTLNEVLLYEKLDGGILHLEKISFHAVDFLHEYTAQFNTKASRRYILHHLYDLLTFAIRRFSLALSTL